MNPRRLIASVVTRPLVLRIAAPLRNAWWQFRGMHTSNPALPERVHSMLFVCLGNICRSPFGAKLAKQLLAEAGRGDVRCTSAGIRPSQDAGAPWEACSASETYGVGLGDHQPQALTRALMESHDITIVMEWRQLARLRAAYPERWHRIFLLPLFDREARNAYERYNIADPFGQPLAAYEQCYRRMDRALRCLIASTRQ